MEPHNTYLPSSPSPRTNRFTKFNPYNKFNLRCRWKYHQYNVPTNVYTQILISSESHHTYLPFSPLPKVNRFTKYDLYNKVNLHLRWKYQSHNVPISFYTQRLISSESCHTYFPLSPLPRANRFTKADLYNKVYMHRRWEYHPHTVLISLYTQILISSESHHTYFPFSLLLRSNTFTKSNTYNKVYLHRRWTHQPHTVPTSLYRRRLIFPES